MDRLTVLDIVVLFVVVVAVCRPPGWPRRLRSRIIGSRAWPHGLLITQAFAN